VVISKVDLAEAVGFDRQAAGAALAQVAPQAAVVEVSARSGAGIGRLRELCG
jgi:hydrogenase nickel incorporation protein HypB